MKKIITSLLVLTSVVFTNSQEQNDLKEVVLESVNLTSINVDYLTKVQDPSMSIHVKTLEQRVANCDITKSAKYDGRDDVFTAVFKSQKGQIKATYNKEGKVLTTSEYFKNIKLPQAIRTLVFKDYPGWVLLNDSYSVSYKDTGDIKKTYKVQIGFGKTRKNFKIDCSDEALLLANNKRIITNNVISYVEVKN